MLYSIVGILVIIVDQLVKFWVEDTLFGTDIVRFIPGVISLVNVHNYGAAFGFLDTSGARIYFLVAAGLFALLVVIALATNFITGRFSRWCLVLVAAGGLGNMIDRLLYGYVVDMFKVELFNFPVFNVADIFITVFSILFVLAMFFEKPEEDVEALYEDLEEEEKPKKAKKRRKKGEEPAPGEELVPAAAAEEKPVKQKKVSAARKARQDKYEKEYEEYKAQQQEAMRKAAAARNAAAQAPRTEDPFAAWEKANARAEAARADDYAGRVMQTPTPQSIGSAARAEAPKTEVRPAVQSAAPAAPKAEVRPAAPKAEPAPVSAPAPQPKAEPAPQPKAESVKPKSAPAEEEFNLDDILAEFR
jgi:signal peptidase II